MTDVLRGRGTAWLVFALVAAAAYGNFYVYDSIGPVADLLQRERGFSDTQIGMLNAIYSLPNVVLVLVGGLLVDRFGAARMAVGTAAVCLVGSMLTAFSPEFAGMAAGRLLFGIGAETLQHRLDRCDRGLLRGPQSCLRDGTEPCHQPRGLVLRGHVAVVVRRVPMRRAGSRRWSLRCCLPRRRSPRPAVTGGSIAGGVARSAAPAAGSSPRFAAADLRGFGTAYWFLLVLCVLWYAVILAFRSTFSIKYFQHAHGLDLAMAGAMNSYVFLAAMFATPAFGWLCDKTGRYAPMLAFGALLLPLSFVIMATTDWSLWVATALMGVSFSLVPAVMWPLTSKLVPAARFGTALGLMWVVQNAGIAGANLVAGWLNDVAGASAVNPAGYQPMMLFFGTTSALGFGFALMLWFVAGRRHHEAVTR